MTRDNIEKILIENISEIKNKELWIFGAGNTASLYYNGLLRLEKEGFYIERRGRKATGRPAKLKKEVEEDLIAEVQRLRAENAYLKKLNALVYERVRQEKKHK